MAQTGIVMEHTYLVERFRRATRILIDHWEIDRIDAVRNASACLAEVKASDLPAALRDDFEGLQSELANLTDTNAAKISERLGFLYWAVSSDEWRD